MIGMRLTLAIVAVAASAGAAVAFASQPGPIAGRWLTGGGKAVVQVATCGEAICGRIERVLDPRAPQNARDVNNPDQSLRSRPIEGLTILSGFTPAGTRWRGRIYDPETGRTYRSEMWRENATLKVKGCWGPFCQTQSWTVARAR